MIHYSRDHRILIHCINKKQERFVVIFLRAVYKNKMKKKDVLQTTIKSNRRTYLSTERVMENVPCPPIHLLTIKEIFGNSSAFERAKHDSELMM